MLPEGESRIISGKLEYFKKNYQVTHPSHILEINELNKGLKIDNHYMHGEVKILEYSPDKIVLEVTSDGEGILVVSNTYSKYWHAKINGKNTKIFKTNHALWGLKVDKGSRTYVLSVLCLPEIQASGGALNS